MTTQKPKFVRAIIDAAVDGPIEALTHLGVIVRAILSMQQGIPPDLPFFIDDVVSKVKQLRPELTEDGVVATIRDGIVDGYFSASGSCSIAFTPELFSHLMENARRKADSDSATTPKIASTFTIMGKAYTSKEVEALCHLLAVYHDHAERFGMPPDNSFTFGGLTFDHKTIMELLECMAEDPIFRLVLGSYHPNSQVVNVQRLYRFDSRGFGNRDDRSRDRGGYDRDGGGRYGTRNDRGRF